VLHRTNPSNILIYNYHQYYFYCIPTGLRQKHKAYLGTAQQYTEVSSLLWVQGLAQCRKIVHMYVTMQAVIHMSEVDVQC